MMPAVAPIAAGKPQPMASMRPTGMPHSRADAGFCAAARMASPVEVKRKKTNRRTSITSVTAITPRSRVVISAAEHRPVGERAREILNRVAVDPARERIEDQQEPDGDDDRGEDRRVLDRPDHDALDHHAAEERDASVMTKAAQKGRPAFTSVQAM